MSYNICIEIKEAVVKIEELLKEYGLGEWKVTILRAKRIAGRCYHIRKVIGISKHLTENRVDSEVMNTITHELAHAIIGLSKRPHNWKFRR